MRGTPRPPNTNIAMPITAAAVPARPPCPARGKRRYPTREDAERGLGNIWAHGHNKGPGSLPCRAYLCPCGNWHLTSKPDDRCIVNPTPTPPTR